MTKSILSGLFGLLATMLNVPFNGGEPVEVGFITFGDKVPLMIMLVGIFSAPELYKLTKRKKITCGNAPHIHSTKSDIKGGIKTLIKYRWSVIRSSLVGLFVGLLPAGGGALSSMSSYFLAKKLSRNKKQFGEGAVEGVVAAECSNSASICGAIIVLLILGIPSSNSASILYGLMLETGTPVGGSFYLDNLSIVYAIIAAGIFSSVVLALLTATMIPYITRLANINTRIILPALTALIVVMSYLYRSYNGDVLCLILFSVIGIVMNKYHYPAVSFILGLLLGYKIRHGFEELTNILMTAPEILLQKPVSMLAMVAIAYLLTRHICSLKEQK
ncbi:tripartite tricarboxylate transporter permease [Vibrio sp. HN007]|uniref:tripartite tricarboxylate transporter permease n=1 Tax=Vibrio iocasae TaxID=3098914 RepID=UPI0035D4461E